uniref:Uncharacterized protein n=1 Tax=Anguilla anguilla TaxID=7936 RepID=A0A0E9UIH6_ANGAN
MNPGKKVNGKKVTGGTVTEYTL